MDHEQARTLGASLREISGDLLKQPSPGIRRRWFQGGEAYFDLFFEADDDGLRWFQLTLRGRCLTWDRAGRSLRTGDTREGVADDAQPHPASKVISEHRTLDRDFAAVALAILRSRPADRSFVQAAEAVEEGLS